MKTNNDELAKITVLQHDYEMAALERRIRKILTCSIILWLASFAGAVYWMLR